MSNETNIRAFQYHTHARSEYLEEYRRLVDMSPMFDPAQQAEFAGTLLDRIAHFDNLRAAADHVSSQGGRTPGPNGVMLSDIPSDQLWHLLGTIGKLIRNGEYNPGRERRSRIRKPSGGTRELSLTNIEHRVVERAIVHILQPLVDPLFGDWVFGGRPGRSPWQALATAEVFAKRGHTTWLCDDIKGAFDHVPLARLIQVLPKYGIPDNIIALISRITERRRGKGLKQGGALSPLLMNIYLDHFLDGPWKQNGQGPLIRFVDDLVVPLPAGADAGKEYSKLGQLLRICGMPLKGKTETAIVDLARGDKVNWLGFEISRGESGLQFDLPLDSRPTDKPPRWAEDLEPSLRACHEFPNPVSRAEQVLYGKLHYFGPFYSTARRAQFYKRIDAIARSVAFDEIPSRDQFLDRWKEYHEHWLSLRRTVALDLAARCAPQEGLEFQVAPDESNGDANSRYHLYTHGCRLEDKVGGWACIALRPGGRRVSHTGAKKPMTSNQAELTAVIRGLQAIPEGAMVTMHTDSQYVASGIECLEIWRLTRWCRGRNGDGGKVKNFHLWQELKALLDARSVTCQKVSAHSGHRLNELCDALANEAAQKMVAKLANR